MKGLRSATRGLVVGDVNGSSLLQSGLGCERFMVRPWAEELTLRAQAARGPRALDAVAAWFDEAIAPRAAQAVQADRSAVFRAMCHLSLMDLREEALAYAAFVRAGSQVFTLSDEYVFNVGYAEGDPPFTVPSELPYPALFLAFRGRASMTISDGIRPEDGCDGCFVRTGAREELHLLFTFKRDGDRATGLPGASLRLSPRQNAALGLRQHVEDELRRRGLDVWKLREPARQGQNGLTVAQVDRMAGLLSYQREVRGWAVSSAARLVLRSLESLRDLPVQAQSKRQSGDSPQPLRDSAAPYSPAQDSHRRTVRLRLSQQALVCNGIGHQRVVGSISEHWRRAHWRRQPCGPERTDMRLVRVREARVGKNRASDASRTYVVLP